MATVDLIIVTWNSEEWLPRCLASVRELDGEINPIFVDNASTDASLSILERFGQGTIIRNEKNRGFSAAANQGIAAGSAPWIQLLNPDAVLDPDYTTTLVAAGEGHPDVGSLTGLLVRGKGPQIEPTNVVDTRGIVMTRSGRHLDIDADTIVKPLPLVDEVFGVSGAAALYRREFLEHVSIEGEIFDEDFFAYREDADLAWRGRVMGWRALSVCSAKGVHIRRVTPERRRELPPEINCHSVKNRFLLRWKNAGTTQLLMFAPYTIVRDMIVLMATLTVETSSLPAWVWLWRNRKRVSAKRREVQSRRTVSDLELAHWFRP